MMVKCEFIHQKKVGFKRVIIMIKEKFFVFLIQTTYIDCHSYGLWIKNFIVRFVNIFKCSLKHEWFSIFWRKIMNIY